MSTLRERFDEKWIGEPNSGCWLWTGGTKGTMDYGSFGNAVAHRVSYTLHVGPIPPGKWVLHKCDTPLCVNPLHLFPGTHADNMRDMALKERSAQTKLTTADVIAIRASSESHPVLAKRFGVKRPAITKIRARMTWKHAA